MLLNLLGRPSYPLHPILFRRFNMRQAVPVRFCPGNVRRTFGNLFAALPRAATSALKAKPIIHNIAKPIRHRPAPIASTQFALIVFRLPNLHHGWPTRLRQQAVFVAPPADGRSRREPRGLIRPVGRCADQTAFLGVPKCSSVASH